MALFKKKNKEEAKVQVDNSAEVKVEKTVEESKKKTSKKAEKSVGKKTVAARGSSILLGPVVTEKTAQLSDKNVIVFKVANKANKVEIRNEIKALYGIVPERVNIVNTRGKQVRFGRREGKRIDAKKAIITLPKGKTIDIFEGV